MEAGCIPGPCELEAWLENTAGPSTILPQPLSSMSSSALGGVC